MGDLKMAFVNELDKLRTIDHGRNIVLRCTGSAGGDEHYDFFELNINGAILKFGATYSKNYDPEKKFTVDWTIDQINVPEKFEGTQSEIANIISDALKEYGYIYRKNNVKKTTVEFGKNLKFPNGVKP